ncbi:MAG: sulfatase [Candidatus Hodarchaeota archaeon]
MPFNVILVIMDAVRPDHLGAYGYQGIKTPNIDQVAEEGVVFEGATAASCLTPIAHGSILTGNNPPVHNMRDPFSRVEGTMISEVLKEHGYNTAGFVAVGFLSALHGFARGFDHYNEPKEEEAWESKIHVSEDGKEEKDNLKGNMWRDDMFDWLQRHVKERFFIFGHYFECHWGMENYMLKKGLLKEYHLSEYDYYDAKIEYMDKYLVGPMIDLLKKLGMWEHVILILTADHGENLGEHEVPPPFYPQHRTLYECDMRIPLIIKCPTFPKNKRIRGLVRSVDIVPTLYEILDIKGIRTDGQSLVNFVEKGEAKNLVAYSEELYSRRGFGDYQAMKSDTYKYIINRRTGREEFFHLVKDPDEKNNLIGNLSEEEKKLKAEWQGICNEYLEKRGTQLKLSKQQRDKVEERLRKLGYKRA